MKTFKTQADFRIHKQIYNGQVPQHYIILEMVNEETRVLALQRNKKEREDIKGILRDDEMIPDLYYQYLIKRLTEIDGDIAEVIID
jgi:hypothetical protein